MRKWLPLLLLFWSGLAAAQEPSPELRARLGELATVLRGEGDPAALFTPAFLAQVPAAQVRAIGTQLAGQYGAIRGEARITPVSASAGGPAVRLDSMRSSPAAARVARAFSSATISWNVLRNGW